MNHLNYRIMGQKYMHKDECVLAMPFLTVLIYALPLLWVFMLNVYANAFLCCFCPHIVHTDPSFITWEFDESCCESGETRQQKTDPNHSHCCISYRHSQLKRNRIEFLARKQFHLLAFIASRISTQTIFIVELKQGRAHKIRQCDVRAYTFLTFCKLHNDDCWLLNTALSGLDS